MIDYSQPIPVFPLPNAVLLPKAVVPLHIFESRYRCMTVDALRGAGLISIALLKEGFQPTYHTLQAPIHPIVCVGRITKSERLCDGRFNILVEGIDRAEVLDEDTNGPYRRAILHRIEPTPPAPELECELFGCMRRLVTSPRLRPVAETANWTGIFECPNLTLSTAADLLAYSILSNPCDKQRFLAEPCTRKRACLVISMLEAINYKMEMTAGGCDKRDWPPKCSDN